MGAIAPERGTMFKNQLCAQCVSDGVWLLLSPLRYGDIVIPEGFYTDFASVPRVPFVFEAWGDRAHREATLHDYLYRIDSIPVVSRAEADRIFLEAMLSTGKPTRIAYPMYWGVRLAGWTAYHKKNVKDIL